MRKYGKLLLTELADETTRLLQSLCTEWIPRGQQPSSGTTWYGIGSVCHVMCHVQRRWFLIGQIPHSTSSCLSTEENISLSSWNTK